MSVIVCAVAFSFTLFIILICLGYLSLSSLFVNTTKQTIDIKNASPAVVAQMGNELDAEISNKFREWGAIIRAESNLISISTSGMQIRNGMYHGVKASFCKIDWEQYKKDPPSLPMFKFLV